jgi:hypothetical protein
MRESTEVWLQMESKGRPQFNVTKQVTIRKAVMDIAQWLLTAHMGHRIEIRIARTVADLKPLDIRDDTSMMNELESLLNSQSENDEQKDLPDGH